MNKKLFVLGLSLWLAMVSGILWNIYLATNPPDPSNVLVIAGAMVFGLVMMASSIFWD